MTELNDDAINQKLVEYAKDFEEYKWTCEKANNILNNFALSNSEMVYSIKSRIKTAESLINKLRKKDHSTDIVGLRILYYFREDIPEINKYLIKNFNCKEIEIYVFKNDEDIFKSIFQKEKYEKEGIHLNIDTDKPNEGGYTGIHYIVLLKDGDRQNYKEVPIEIQVKTLFEEAWGELEHGIGYKHSPMEIQQFFQPISEKLSTEYKTMTKLKAYIDKKTKEFSMAIEHYYHFDVSQEAINQLLIDLDVKVERALEKIRSLDKLGAVYQKILPMDIRLKSLKIILSHYDTNENMKIKIESVLVKTFFDRLLEEGVFFQNEKEIFYEFSSDPKNLFMPLNGLNSILKRGFSTTKLNGIDVVNDFLRDIWEKNDMEKSEKFLVLEILLRIWEHIKDNNVNVWKSSIKKYFESVEDDRDKEEIIRIIEWRPMQNNPLRIESIQHLLSELKKLRGDA